MNVLALTVFLLVLIYVVGTAVHGTCRDTYPSKCRKHKQNGHCRHPEWKVKTHCKKSCNFCHSQHERKQMPTPRFSARPTVNKAIRRTKPVARQKRGTTELVPTTKDIRGHSQHKRKQMPTPRFSARPTVNKAIRRTKPVARQKRGTTELVPTTKDIRDPNCKDDKEECSYVASLGYCQKKPILMHRYCKKSCRVCE